MAKVFKVFSAPTCGNCNNVKMQLDKNNIKYEVVNVEELSDEELGKLSIRAIPMVTIEVDGVETKRFVGINKEKLEEIKKEALEG